MSKIPTSVMTIDPASLKLDRRAIGAAPLVDAVLCRLGFGELLANFLPEPDVRCALAPARVIGVLVANLALARQPLYGLSAWAAGYGASFLGLGDGEAAFLNDDRVGRALDQLFGADRASLLTELSLRVIRRYDINVSELHNDSTSIVLYGSYRDACGAPRGGVCPPVPERGFSKDHRGDLKQLVEILTISADGAVPIAHRLADGGTEDSTTHVATWDGLVSMLGTPSFTYVADCKLATRDSMDHIATNNGRFLTILPRSRKEDETGRAWIASGAPKWEEISRCPGKRLSDPDEVYVAAEAPSPSAEGYRIVWLRSSDKRVHDAVSRTERIERARAGVAGLDETLRSPRSRLKTLLSVEDAGRAIVADASASRWVRAEITDTVCHEHRQVGRGRPGKDTRYRRIEHHRFSVTSLVDAEAVAFDAAADGCFPFVTNEDLPPAELLRIYKFQPHIERRHATFKGVLEATPLTLKSDTRIDALGLCLYVALLVHALVERGLRRAMAEEGVASLPLYYEDRACAAPTAARVFELLEPLCHTTIYSGDDLLMVAPPSIDPLQRQILTLLKIPTQTYEPSPRTLSGNSR